MSPTGPHNRLHKFDILWSQTYFNLSGWALLLSLDQTVRYGYTFTLLYLTWVYYSCLFFMEIASVFVQFRVPKRRKLKTEKNLHINQLSFKFFATIMQIWVLKTWYSLHGIFANIFKMLSSKRPNIVTSTEYCPDFWTKFKKPIGIGNV